MKLYHILRNLMMSFMVLSVWTVSTYAKESVIEIGKKVSMRYTLSVDDNVKELVEENEPFEYVHGFGMLIAGLENRLEGLKKGDERDFDIEPHEAYGLIEPNAVIEFPIASLAPDTILKKGESMEVKLQTGEVFDAYIAEVRDKTILLNLNHPLAGKRLHFQVKILDIQ